ncbi:MAG TPA: hypothetical protein VKY74_11020, partial [Chloroflexia bacterium]|nr:hypothetical protein [Chloroflexia bacterium]
KRRQVQLTVVSPEPTIIGLARIYGFEVENLSTQKRAPVPVAAPDEDALPQWNRREAPAAPAAPPPATMPSYGGAFDLPAPAAPPPAAAPAAPPPAAPRPVATPAGRPAPPVSENDWLFGGDLPNDTLEMGIAPTEDAPRTAIPPPDVALPRGVTFAPAAAARPTPPPAPAAAGASAAGDLDDLDNLNFDDADLEAQSAQYTHEIAVQAAARQAERAAAGIPDPKAPTPVDDGTSPAAAAASVAGTNLMSGMNRMLGRKPPPAAPEPPAGGRTFVDKTGTGGARPTVLGSAAASLERRAVGAPPSDAERAGVSNQPLNGRSSTHLGPIPAAEAAAVGAGVGAAASTAGGAAAATAASAPAAPAAAAGPRPVARPIPRVVGPAAQTGPQPATRRRGLLLPVLGVLAVAVGIVVVAMSFNSTTSPPTPAAPTVTIHIRLRTVASLDPILVKVPVLTTSATGASVPGLAAPALQVTGTTPLRPTAPAGNTTLTAPAVRARQFTTTVVASATLATTGQRVVAWPATGQIQISNRSEASLAVPANREITGLNGKTFHTVLPLTVPGTNFVTLQIGHGEVEIIADAPGPDSNGQSFSREYGNAVFATIGTTGGGGNLTVKTETPQNRTDLEGQLRAAIDARARPQLLAAIPPALRVISCTMPASIFDNAGVDMVPAVVNHTVPSPNLDLATGRLLPMVVTETLQLQGKMTTQIGVYAFDPAAVRAAAARKALDAAPSGLPVPAQIDPASVPSDTLTLDQASACENGQVLYSTVFPSPRVRYTFP